MPGRRNNNEGSVYEDKDGVWWAQLTAPDGSRPRRRAKTKRDALAKLAQMKAEQTKGVDLTAKQPTVSQWCDTWLTVHASHLRQNIREDYEGLIRLYIHGRSIGGLRLDKINGTIVQAWVNDLSSHLAPRSVRNVHMRLLVALDVAVEEGLISRNPAASVKLPQLTSTSDDIHPYTLSQVQALIAAIEGTRWEAIYLLAANLGMRQAEILGLTWDKFDEKRGELRIEQQLQRVKNEDDPDGPKVFVLQIPKTKSGRRTLKLSAELVEALVRHRTNQELEQGMGWETHWPERGGLMFVTTTGAPFHGSEILQHFRRLQKRIGLPEIRFHDLRHTAATLMLDDGTPLITVSKVLGHSTPAITAVIYGHALDESKSNAIDGLSKKIRRRDEDKGDS